MKGGTIVMALAILALWTPATGGATTIPVASCEGDDVGSALGKANDGDVVTVPAGKCTWTRTVNIPTKVTLMGAGADQTIIVDDVPKTGGKITPHVIGVAGGARLSGLTIDGGSGKQSSFTHGLVQAGGTGFRIDHVKLIVRRSAGLWIVGSGLVDHSEIRMVGWRFGVYVMNGGRYGDEGMATPQDVARRTRAVVFEDNHFNSSSGTCAFDGWRGGVTLIRRNTFTNTWVCNHGTDSGGRERTIRIIDVVGNTFRKTAPATQPYPPVHYRGGTGVTMDNVITGQWNGLGLINNFRQYMAHPPFGGANGLSPWDKNDPEVKASGTHTGPKAVVDNRTRVVLTDETKSWTPNQFAGYAVINKRTKHFGAVIANDANTLTALTDSSRSWALLEWRPGDPYEVRHVLVMFDSAGRGKSDPIAGANPAPEGWPNQLSEPIYIHNNTIDGAVRKMSAQGGRLKEGVDFIHGPPPAEITEAWPPYPHPLAATAPASGGR